MGLSTGVAARGSQSEFADAAGLAPAQTYGANAGSVPGIAGSPDAAVSAFTLMKVIGRDVWIGSGLCALPDRDDALGTYRCAEQIERRRIWNRFSKILLGSGRIRCLTLVTRGFDYAAYKRGSR